MSKVISIARLREDQIDGAVEVLAASYFNEPYSIAFEPNYERRLSAWRRGFIPDVRYCLCHGEPHIASRAGIPIGVALWMPPHVETPMPEEQQEFGLDGLREIFGEAYTHFLPLERLLRTLRRESMNRPHWFLRLLGIAPAETYEEVGSVLLRPMLLHADEARLPCYAETGSPRQLSLYERVGFKVLTHGVEPASGIEFWTLCREPFSMEPRA